MKKLFALGLAGVLGIAGLLALNQTSQAAAPVAPSGMHAMASESIGIGPFATYAEAWNMAQYLVRYKGWDTAVVIEQGGYFYVGAAS